jgi:hypothetical protein
MVGLMGLGFLAGQLFRVPVGRWARAEQNDPEVERQARQGASGATMI